MIKTNKKTKKRTKTKAEKPKMRGGMLGHIAGSLRLRQRVIDEIGGTARTGLSDQRDVGRHRHVEMTRALVDGLFTEEYLKARGLGPNDAKEHNDLVTQAMETLLTRYDRLALRDNLGIELHELGRMMLLHHEGLNPDLPVRLAAYDALYGHLHPALGDVRGWLGASKLAGWWSSMEERATKRVVVKQLHRRGQLTPQNVGKLKKGDSLPNETNVDILAERLAEFDIRSRSEDCCQTAAEIAFEIRIAAAVAENRALATGLLNPNPEDVLVAELLTMRHLLRSVPDRHLVSLLRDGTGSPNWPGIEVELHRVHVARLVERATAMKAQVDRDMGDMATNPTKASRALAAMCEDQAKALRSGLKHGDDGPELRMIEEFEWRRAVALAVATKGRQPPPQRREELSAEQKADGLCLDAIAPWQGHDDATKEKLFREATEVASWLAYPWRMLASHLQQTGRHEEAVEQFRKAFELNPDNLDGREALTMALVDQEGWQETVEVTDPPTSSSLASLRGWALIQLGQFEEARQLADRVLKEHPSHSVALWVRAACLRADGKVKDAKALEKKADFNERGVAPPGS